MRYVLLLSPLDRWENWDRVWIICPASYTCWLIEPGFVHGCYGSRIRTFSPSHDHLFRYFYIIYVFYSIYQYLKFLFNYLLFFIFSLLVRKCNLHEAGFCFFHHYFPRNWTSAWQIMGYINWTNEVKIMKMFTFFYEIFTQLYYAFDISIYIILLILYSSMNFCHLQIRL